MKDLMQFLEIPQSKVGDAHDSFLLGAPKHCKLYSGVLSWSATSHAFQTAHACKTSKLQLVVVEFTKQDRARLLDSRLPWCIILRSFNAADCY